MDTFKQTLLISVDELKQDSMISGNVNDKDLRNIVMNVQEIYLSKITGTPLYRRLQELVYNAIKGYDDSIYSEGNEQYLELWESYVKPYIRFKAQQDSVFGITYKFKNIGVTQNSDTNINTLDVNTLRYMESHYATYVDEASQKLSGFLCFNKELFVELSADVPGYLDNPMLGKSFANTGGLWLGGRKNKTTCGGCGNG